MKSGKNTKTKAQGDNQEQVKLIRTTHKEEIKSTAEDGKYQNKTGNNQKVQIMTAGPF